MGGFRGREAWGDSRGFHQHDTIYGLLAVGAALRRDGGAENQKEDGGIENQELPTICPLLFSPVCAEDISGEKTTFDNDCLLTASARRRQSGLRKLHDGAC